MPVPAKTGRSTITLPARLQTKRLETRTRRLPRLSVSNPLTGERNTPGGRLAERWPEEKRGYYYDNPKILQTTFRQITRGDGQTDPFQHRQPTTSGPGPFHRPRCVSSILANSTDVAIPPLRRRAVSTLMPLPGHSRTRRTRRDSRRRRYRRAWGASRLTSFADSSPQSPRSWAQPPRRGHYW